MNVVLPAPLGGGEEDEGGHGGRLARAEAVGEAV